MQYSTVKENSFAERLRIARMQAGMSGHGLAEAVGIRYDTYMSYENRGREPKQSVLVRIADVLHVTTDSLLGASDTGSGKDLITKNDLSGALVHAKAILGMPAVVFRGRALSARDVEELSSRLDDLAKRADMLAARGGEGL